jgi:hypothetical protein
MTELYMHVKSKKVSRFRNSSASSPTHAAPLQQLFPASAYHRQLLLGSAIEPQLPSYDLKGVYTASNHDFGYPYKLYVESFQQRSRYLRLWLKPPQPHRKATHLNSGWRDPVLSLPMATRMGISSQTTAPRYRTKKRMGRERWPSQNGERRWA